MFSEHDYKRIMNKLNAQEGGASPYAIFKAAYELAVRHSNPIEPALWDAFPTMLPSTFKEQNNVAQPPLNADGELEPGVMTIPVHVHEHGIITCWKMTDAMVEEMKRTKRVYVSLLGHALPPMRLQVMNPVADLPAAPEAPTETGPQKGPAGAFSPN